MKYLVTGGAGFLGSHLCKRLLDQNHEVICMDNLYTGKKSNIINLLEHSRFKFLEQDVLKELDLNIDGIFNLACPASPIKYQHDPVYTSKISYLGTLNLINLAIKNKSKFLLASTSEVYGDPLEHPQKENYFGNVNSFGPRACYDEGKRIAETLCYDHHKKFNLKIRIPRIFNTYGPNMSVNDGRVISNFIVCSLKNKNINVFGRGEQTRSFCYVDDLIDGIIKLYNSKSKQVNKPINLGNPIEIKIIDLCKLIIKITNSKSKIIFKPLPENDPLKRQPDISIAQKYLSWEPQYNLIDGLKNTIKYFEKELSLNKTN